MNIKIEAEDYFLLLLISSTTDSTYRDEKFYSLLRPPKIAHETGKQ